MRAFVLQRGDLERARDVPKSGTTICQLRTVPAKNNAAHGLVGGRVLEHARARHLAERTPAPASSSRQGAVESALVTSTVCALKPSEVVRSPATVVKRFRRAAVAELDQQVFAFLGGHVGYLQLR